MRIAPLALNDVRHAMEHRALVPIRHGTKFA
jgi:hypothetical protein